MILNLRISGSEITAIKYVFAVKSLITSVNVLFSPFFHFTVPTLLQKYRY